MHDQIAIFFLYVDISTNDYYCEIVFRKIYPLPCDPGDFFFWRGGGRDFISRYTPVKEGIVSGEDMRGLGQA